MNSVCILNYGAGNVKSVYNLFESIVKSVIVSNDPKEILQASHLVLPGVGAFGSAMRKIRESIPLAELEEAVLSKKRPFLGICVGMQVLAESGMEFGEHRGLGWIPGTVEKLTALGAPLPHIGWNNISPKRQSPLLIDLGPEPDFYFVHSFVFHATDPGNVLATSEYGEEFCSVIQSDNIYGVQFHPEKSQKAGIQLVNNFLAIS